MLCALLQQHPLPTTTLTEHNSAHFVTQADADKDLTWPSATFQYTQFDAWIQSDTALGLPSKLLDLLKDRRLLFPNALPPGLPPKRPHDHHILLVPGKLLTKATLYKMPLDQLLFTNRNWLNFLNVAV